MYRKGSVLVWEKVIKPSLTTLTTLATPLHPDTHANLVTPATLVTLVTHTNHTTVVTHATFTYLFYILTSASLTILVTLTTTCIWLACYKFELTNQDQQAWKTVLSQQILMSTGKALRSGIFAEWRCRVVRKVLFWTKYVVQFKHRVFELRIIRWQSNLSTIFSFVCWRVRPTVVLVGQLSFDLFTLVNPTSPAHPWNPYHPDHLCHLATLATIASMILAIFFFSASLITLANFITLATSSPTLSWPPSPLSSLWPALKLW